MAENFNKIILASASPRRSEILTNNGVDFEICVSKVEELKEAQSPKILVMQNAMLKAKDVALQHKDRLVLGADTIVVLGDEVFGKPKHEAEAISMLEKLQGKSHYVYTAIALVCEQRGIEISDMMATEVQFKPLSREDILKYINAVYVLDKAGAYAVQDNGAMIINSMGESFENVMGLDSALVKKHLKAIFESI